MNPQEEPQESSLNALSRVFSEQLTACLEECLRGRLGLFGEPVQLEAGDDGWPEAAQLRALAMALQGIYAQNEERCALAEEFLDLCSMHGESNPGERRLARVFLERIEGGKVGSPTQEEHPW